MHPLDEYLAQGEHLHQDFKFFLSDAKKIARSLAAFANTDGGRLLVGVKDNGKVVGLKHKDEEAYVVEAAALVFCKPQVTYETHVVDYYGKAVLVVEVPQSKKAPHRAPDEKGVPTCYIRKADENKAASALEEKVLQLTHSGKPLQVPFTPYHERLLSYLNNHPNLNNHPSDGQSDYVEGIAYDVNKLAVQCLLTPKECLLALAQLIASGVLPPCT